MRYPLMRGERVTYDGQKLSAILEEQGRRAQWLADRTGRHKSPVSRMLSGQQPMTEEFAREAAALLQIPVDLLRADREPAEIAS